MARSDHPLHSMSYYVGAYPPRVPRRIIERWVGPKARVLDPFCGSGTTLVEAKLLGRPSIGIDLNPLAVAVSQAKLQPVHLQDLMDRLTSLSSGFRGESEIEDVPAILSPIFHKRTFVQLCYLRRALTNKTREDVFLRGCLLGIMHGKHRRDGSTAYLSVDMPNTFSMSPEYLRRFVERNGLHQPPIDVFSKLRERATWLLRSGALPETPHAEVIHGDAGRLDELVSQLGISSVDAIVTSPPYLGILRYGTFNWIRLWFLGYDQYTIDRLLKTTDSLDTYLSFMLSFFDAAGRILRPGGIAALVIGDITKHGQNLPLAQRVWEELCGLIPFELVESCIDAYDESAKTTRIWGEQRKGRATPRDRVIVLRRITTRRGQSMNHGIQIVAQQQQEDPLQRSVQLEKEKTP